MPHRCDAILKHHYDVLLDLYFSPEAGRVIETIGAAAAIFVIASVPVRKMLITLFIGLLMIGCAAAFKSSAVSAIEKQFISCHLKYSVRHEIILVHSTGPST
jgi:hypothetical protein